MRILKILAFSGTALAACSSYGAPLTAAQILTQFNVVSKTTLTTGHDIEGRVVANEITGGATFYNKPDGSVSNYAAINAIKIDNFNANINNGGKVDYQTTNGARFNYNGGGSASQSPSFAMSDFTTPLDALSDQLGLLSANSFVNASDPNRFTFNLTPNAAGTAVFDLSTALLSTSRNLLFSGSAQTIIINVTGTSFFDTSNFNADAFLNSHVIWNFEDATSLSFQNWHGAVLAGDAAVTNSSAMEGMLYAKSFTGNGELHDVSFLGTLPADPAPPAAVPEPATIATFLTGLLLLAFAGRRQRQRQNQAQRRPVIAA
jgi:choice-of-anchor A domain-containing protein